MWRHPEPARLLPTWRSLAVGFALLALALGCYAVARESSLFGITTIEVRGADAPTAAAVRLALAPLRGRSLLALHADQVERRADALPAVVSVTYDRDFPHTLRVIVREERPIAVLRRGPAAYLLSARARIIRTLPSRTFLDLPRVWVSHATSVVVGATIGGDPGLAAKALVPLSRARLPEQVASSEAAGGELTFRLRNGIELRLGDARELALKLAIARRILPALPPVTGGYLDVSVPERPVSGVQQVSSRR